MEPLSLEQTTLINISTSLWMTDDMKPFMIKQSNGLITLDKALPLLKTKIFGFPITLHLKKRLMSFVQKTGYELYVFLNKFTTKNSFEMKVEWTLEGTINERKTLHLHMENGGNNSVSHFKIASTVFDESSVKRIWSCLSESEKKSCRRHFRNALFPSYWIYEMENRLSDFPGDYGPLIIGFDRNNNLNFNMLWHSIVVNNKNGAYYFHNKLTENDTVPGKNFERDLLKYVIETGRSEGFEFVLSLLQKPIVDEQIAGLIFNITDCEYLKKFLEFVLRQVNVFGDLHFDIFCHLLLHASRECPSTVEENLDFYALTLLSKGKCENFHFLSQFDAKNILHRRMYYRLREKHGLCMLATIHFNKYTELLRSYLNWLAITDEDRNFFNESVTAIINGTQYDVRD